jgi:hypothetical protein
MHIHPKCSFRRTRNDHRNATKTSLGAADIDGNGPLFRTVHDLRVGSNGSNSLDGARRIAMAASNGPRGHMRPNSNQQRCPRKVLHPLPPHLRGRRRAKHGDYLFRECSFARSLAIPAQPDWPTRRLGSGSPHRNAHRRALQSRPPRESSPRKHRHAARRSANAEQCKTTGSLCGKFRDPANNRANDTPAIPSAERSLDASLLGYKTLSRTKPIATGCRTLVTFEGAGLDATPPPSIRLKKSPPTEAPISPP